jgi:hypothetical protein
MTSRPKTTYRLWPSEYCKQSPGLDAGVNRATDRLSKKAQHFLTLSTLRELMRTFAGSSEVEETELEGLAVTAAEFLDMLASVRRELRVEPHTPKGRAPLLRLP